MRKSKSILLMAVTLLLSALGVMIASTLALWALIEIVNG